MYALIGCACCTRLSVESRWPQGCSELSAERTLCRTTTSDATPAPTVYPRTITRLPPPALPRSNTPPLFSQRTTKACGDMWCRSPMRDTSPKPSKSPDACKLLRVSYILIFRYIIAKNGDHLFIQKQIV